MGEQAHAHGSAASTVICVIDLRSDTVSTPSDEMRAAMAAAEVGDDVWGDDPTVKQLEAYAAELLGKQAAMYVSSGTQSNLCGILAHCGRGDEYIVGANAHAYKYEAGGAAVLGSVQPQPVAMLENGLLDLEQVAAVVKPDDPHFARSKLLCLENTHDGKVQSVAEMHAAAAVAERAGLGLHLDGARVWNAIAALDVAPAELVEPFDTVSVCLSKGLGAPIGSILVGSAELVDEARKWRKMLGGAMRQVGVIAAAGLYALEHNRKRVIDDHTNAAALAAGLGDIDGVEVTGCSTNMVFVRMPVEDGGAFQSALAAHGVQVSMHGPSTRLVTHIDIAESDIGTAIDAVRSVLAG